MSKVITDTRGLTKAIQDKFGCSYPSAQLLVDRFSNDVVIAGDYDSIAIVILHIARDFADRGRDWGNSDSLLADSGIKFEHILDRYRKTDWVEAGFTYEALREAVLEFHTEEECEQFVQRSL